MRRHKRRQDDLSLTPEQAKMICEAVIEQAIEDYQTIPNDRPTPAERDQAIADQRSAKQFFFNPDSNFIWMARALAIDVRKIREALIERGQPHPEPYHPNMERRKPGGNYGTFVDRASRALV